MANDWIKMRHDLREDPSVIAIASAFCPKNVPSLADVDLVIGRLHHIWTWFDKHTTDGFARGVSCEWIDAKVGCEGFAQVMEDEGWLFTTTEGVSMPNFENHNGSSAKRRAADAKRKMASRKCPENVRNSSDKKRTREEKRREEKNTKKTYKESVERLYQLYPRKAGTGKAKEAIEKALEIVSEEVLTEAVQAFAKSPAGNAGKFTPHPATWFNQRRWEDDRADWNMRDDSRTTANRVGPGQRYDPASEPGKL